MCGPWPWTAVETPDVQTAHDGSRTFADQMRIDLTWNDSKLAVLQLLLHAESRSGSRSVDLLDRSGRAIAHAAIGPGDTQIVLGPVPVDGSAGHASFVLQSVPPGKVRIDSIQVQPVANVTKSIVDAGG
jgi:hypothetical protein